MATFINTRTPWANMNRRPREVFDNPSNTRAYRRLLDVPVVVVLGDTAKKMGGKSFILALVANASTPTSNCNFLFNSHFTILHPNDNMQTSNITRKQ